MKINTKQAAPRPHTHGGSIAANITPLQQLRRSVLSCLLWEGEYYEDGKTIAQRIEELVAKCRPQDVAALAISARSEMNLRHVPLLLVCALAKERFTGLAATIEQVIQRPDELTELLAIYWRNGKTPVAKQIQKGLRRAFAKFDAHTLAKYDRNDAAIKLRDIAFLTHVKPKNNDAGRVVAKLVNKSFFPEQTKSSKFPVREQYGLVEEPVGLATPDTWETELSAGKNKRETFERLISEGKLGYLALLRNLRNMATAGCDMDMVRNAIIARKGGAHRVLPFRYVAAARACPQLEPAIDQALSEAISELPVMSGKTVVMVDVSGSMDAVLSSKSDLTRKDAAAALASLINGDVRMFSFADKVVEVPPRRGMAGVDAIVKSQTGGTHLFEAVAHINKNVPYDRLIVITDEQDTTQRGTMPNPKPGSIGYLINVASNKNGVGYGPWMHLDGFSEHVIRWIIEVEKQPDDTAAAS